MNDDELAKLARAGRRARYPAPEPMTWGACSPRGVELLRWSGTGKRYGLNFDGDRYYHLRLSDGRRITIWAQTLSGTEIERTTNPTIETQFENMRRSMEALKRSIVALIAKCRGKR